jgi:AcrR family transcriptional regulator
VTRIKKELVTKAQNQVFPIEVRFASTKNVSLVEDRHQQIVDGACKIFFKKGYHPATIRDIAKACGMSMGQLYHYISSKDDVLYLVHKHMQKVWYDYLEKSDVEQINDPLKKLKEALRQSLKFMVENEELIQFVYSESKYLDKEHLGAVLEMDCQNVIGFWRNLLEGENKRKPVKGDLSFLASLIAFMLVFLPLRGWTLGHKSTRDNVDSLYDFILRGLDLI